MIKQLKDNWAVFLLSTFSLYVMYISSNRADIAEREVEKYKQELDSLNNLKNKQNA